MAGGAFAFWRAADLVALAGATPAVSAAPPPPGPALSEPVTALGRIEPKDGVIRVAGPSDTVVVVKELRVDRGDRVRAGQVIALLDTEALRRAELERAEADLANARAEVERHRALHRDQLISDAERELRERNVQVASATVRHARAALERALVRAPVTGEVLDVHAREGERVGPEGIVELGQTDAMYAIAEVYETDIARVAVGQHATVESPALPRPLPGVVDRIRMKIGKLDALGTDPAAKTDARVIEVEIKLDEADPARALTNLQVEIRIDPGV
jgi:HlyD family secretion protein